MFCEECGSPLAVNDKFCGNCGHMKADSVDDISAIDQQVDQTSAQHSIPTDAHSDNISGVDHIEHIDSTTSVGSTISDKQLDDQPHEQITAQTGETVAVQQDNTLDTDQDALYAQPDLAHFEVAYADAAPQPQERMQSAIQPVAMQPVSAQPVAAQTERSRKKWPLIVLAILGVLALLVIGVCAGYFANSYFHKDGAASSQNMTSSNADRSSSTSKDKTPNTQSDTSDKSDNNQTAQACTSAYTYQVTSAQYSSQSGRFIMQGYFVNAQCARAKSLHENMGITVMKNTDIVAAAYFAFKDKPIALHNGKSVDSVRLEFSSYQSFAPTDVDIAQEVTVKLDTHATPTGQSDITATQEGYVGDNMLTNEQNQAAALAALNAETKRLQSTVQEKIDNRITAQLSSKIEGLNAAGKTWTNADIWQDYLKYKQRFSNAMLLWGEDWPVYTKNGNNARYYVVINGETYGSIDAANQWCSAQGYSRDDCLPMDFARKN